MVKEAVAKVGGITLWRIVDAPSADDGHYLVEEPSRGRITWRFTLDEEGLAWAKFDERALSRTWLDLR
jgi:hypothetical protein